MESDRITAGAFTNFTLGRCILLRLATACDRQLNLGVAYILCCCMETHVENSSGGVIYRRVHHGQFQILLIRIRKDLFELPKGHVEAGESCAEAARRECIEEVGISSLIEVHDLVGDVSYSFTKDEQRIQKNVSYFLISCGDHLKYNKPKRTREIIWVSQNELSNTPLVSDELRSIIIDSFSILCGHT